MGGLSHFSEGVADCREQLLRNKGRGPRCGRRRAGVWFAHCCTAVNGAAAAQQEGEGRGALSWLGLDWGEAGGLGAREVALWVALQREFRRRSVLPAEAVRRLTLLGLEWAPQARHLGSMVEELGFVYTGEYPTGAQPRSCDVWRCPARSGRLCLVYCLNINIKHEVEYRI